VGGAFCEFEDQTLSALGNFDRSHRSGYRSGQGHNPGRFLKELALNLSASFAAGSHSGVPCFPGPDGRGFLLACDEHYESQSGAAASIE
jgi:hypothetical protein